MRLVGTEKWLRPHGDFFYWHDSALELSGICHRDDWPVEWEGKSAELNLLVPCAETVECWVDLPQGVKLDIEGIGYLAEDQLATDLTELHLVLGNKEDNRQQLFGVNIRYLEKWLAVLKSHDSSLLSMYSESEFALQEGVVVAGVEPLLRRNNVTLNLAATTYEALVSTGALPAAKSLIETEYAEEQNWNITERSEMAYWSLLSRLRTNLAVRRYGPAINVRKYWAKYRRVAMLVTVLVAAEILLFGIQAWKLNQEKAALQEAQVALFREVVPQGRIVNAYSQLQALASESSSLSVNDVYGALTELSEVLSSHSDIRFQRVDLRAGSRALNIVLEADDFVALDRFSSALQAKGLQVEIQSSQSRNGITSARIKVEQ
ncbi:type II secretion system protein GspL [Umboniibacter marinipuniceus]|uniref:Type II secretion system protein L n=1 Tax=Umboniibacter marinipuniceus TaxID=569599 RepID=A0A3M0AQP6_9GAMM|nr:type II secretion system protein GspL [Umboniibacter marinipuniceus]RMA81322.1 type II secretion system protein L [Umboniibacter marinipuniceus]